MNRNLISAPRSAAVAFVAGAALALVAPQALAATVTSGGAVTTPLDPGGWSAPEGSDGSRPDPGGW